MAPDVAKRLGAQVRGTISDVKKIDESRGIARAATVV
jgi:hypothetical protein